MLLQLSLIPDIMTKKGNKKFKNVEYDSDEEVAEVAPIEMVEILDGDTKVVTGPEPKL